MCRGKKSASEVTTLWRYTNMFIIIIIIIILIMQVACVRAGVFPRGGPRASEVRESRLECVVRLQRVRLPGLHGHREDVSFQGA